MNKASHDHCFANGCAEAVAGNPCVGICRKLQQEAASVQALAPTLQAEERVSAEAAGPEAQAPVEIPASEQAAKFLAMKEYVEGRLCCNCTNFTKPLGLPVTFGMCRQKDLPTNLITGQRIFPAITARQHVELCGFAGEHWMPKR